MKTQQHGPEDYRWLADQCRQAARTVSTEKERTSLVAKAKTLDVLANHIDAMSEALQAPRTKNQRAASSEFNE